MKKRGVYITCARFFPSKSIHSIDEVEKPQEWMALAIMKIMLKWY